MEFSIFFEVKRVKILKKKHMVDEMTVLFEIMRVKVRNKKKT